jgi:hypothetical protein
MGALYDLVNQVRLPQVYKIRQSFDRTHITSISEEISRQFSQPWIQKCIRPGMKVAVTAGSRGINHIAQILREIVLNLRLLKAEPYIVAAMGSHGGAASQGQVDILKGCGITPAGVDAPILADMEVETIGTTDRGVPVYFAKDALRADATILAGRVKPHTAFHGDIESGVTKIGVIGLGKQKGAESFHSLGMENMATNIIDMGRVMLKKANVAMGFAIVENAYDETCIIEAIPPENLIQRERELLKTAKEKMARIKPGPLDVLVVDEIGKNISGDGADPNITERFYSPSIINKREPQRLVYLDLTAESHGNAIGLGVADFITRKLMNKIDYESMYMNVITNCVPLPAKIPLIMPNARMAVQAAVRTCLHIDQRNLRLVRIKNTLSLEEIFVTQPLLEDIRGRDDIQIMSGPLPLWFDDDNGRKS